MMEKLCPQVFSKMSWNHGLLRTFTQRSNEYTPPPHGVLTQGSSQLRGWSKQDWALLPSLFLLCQKRERNPYHRRQRVGAQTSLQKDVTKVILTFNYVYHTYLPFRNLLLLKPNTIFCFVTLPHVKRYVSLGFNCLPGSLLILLSCEALCAGKALRFVYLTCSDLECGMCC